MKEKCNNHSQSKINWHGLVRNQLLLSFSRQSSGKVQEELVRRDKDAMDACKRRSMEQDAQKNSMDIQDRRAVLYNCSNIQ